MTRRMTLLVLALVGLMVLVVTVAPPQRGPRTRAQSGIEATPTPSPLLTDPDAFDVEATVSATSGDKAPQTIEAQLGDNVQITVQGNQPDSVMLGDLDTEGLEQGVPARFQLLADTPGDYPLVLESDERRIATLQVR